MAQTFNDFMMECETYEYSKERYELMKECAEITLMEQYIANQEFLAEYGSSMTGIAFTEGYFMEAKNDTADVQGKVDEKKKNLFQRIWNGIKKIFNNLISFFTKLFKKGAEDVKFSELEAQRQLEVAKRALEIAKKNAADAKVNALIDANFKTPEDAARFLKKKTFSIRPGKSGYPNAISIDDISDCMKAVSAAAKKNNWANALAVVKNATSKYNKANLKIDVTGDNVTNQLNSLTQLRKDLADHIPTDMNGVNGPGVAEMNQTYSLLMGCVKDTMSIYKIYMDLLGAARIAAGEEPKEETK